VWIGRAHCVGGPNNTNRYIALNSKYLRRHETAVRSTPPRITSETRTFLCPRNAFSRLNVFREYRFLKTLVINAVIPRSFRVVFRNSEIFSKNVLLATGSPFREIAYRRRAFYKIRAVVHNGRSKRLVRRSPGVEIFFISLPIRACSYGNYSEGLVRGTSEEGGILRAAGRNTRWVKWRR